VLPVSGMPVIRQWHATHRKTKQLTPAAADFKTFLVAEGATQLHDSMTRP